MCQHRNEKLNRTMVLVKMAELTVATQDIGSTFSEINNDEKLILIWLNEKSKSTQKSYSTILRQFFQLIPKQIGAINLSDIQNWKNNLIERHKTTTANKKLSAIKSLLNFALRIGYIRINPASVVKSISASQDKTSQSRTPKEKIIANDDIRAMVANADSKRDALLVKVGYTLGLRISELTNLHHNDITPTGEGSYQIKIIGKGGKIRFNNLSADLYAEIKDLNEEGFIFCSNRNQKLSRTMAHYAIKRCARNAGVTEEVSAHYLRHCHASHSLNNGASLKSVQKQLGHSSIAITSVYLHDSESSSNYIVI